MSGDSRNDGRKESETSKELLYSEYMDISSAEHVLNLLNKPKKSKPNMSFQKSSVMERVNKLLPLLEQSQQELNDKPSEEADIEIIDGDQFIEMNVALVNRLNDDFDPCTNEGESLDEDEKEIDKSDVSEFDSSVCSEDQHNKEDAPVTNDNTTPARGSSVGPKELISIIDENISENPANIKSLEDI